MEGKRKERDKNMKTYLLFDSLSNRSLNFTIQFNHKKQLKWLLTSMNKKVLLRERKRHTARRVVSTSFVVLTGYPPLAGHPTCPDLAGGVPCWGQDGEVPCWGSTLPGYPLAGHPPILTWGVPCQGVPPGRVPPGRVPSLDVCPMAFWEMLQSIMGYGYPPSVCPMAFWEMLQSIVGYGYPPVDRQTDTCQNITFPSYYVRGR